MADAAGLTPQLNSAIAAQAMRYATPATIPYVQRSAYLADALQHMQEHGADNLRTPWALGSNLLATALDRVASRHANADLIAKSQANQAGYEDTLLRLANSLGAVGQGGDAPASAAGSPAGGSSPPAVASAGAVSPGTSAGFSGGPTSPSAGGSDPVLAHVLDHFTSEGYSPAAAAGLAGNFQAESNLSPTSLNAKEGAFGVANWNGPRRQALQQFAQAHGGDPNNIDTQLAFTDAELAGPEGHARDLLMSARTPQQGAAAGLAYERPAGYRAGGDPAQASRWNVRLGNAESAFAQTQAPTGQPNAASAAQAPPTPRPLQVSNGADPSVPSQGAGGPVGASPFAVQSSPQRTMSAAPPTGMAATPQEIATIRAYMASPYPEMKAKGEELMQAVIARHAAPIAAPEKMQWDPQRGQYVPLPGAGYTQLQGGPNGGVQANAFGERSTYANPNVGSLGPNQVSNPDGSVSNRTVQQQPTFKIPGANGVFVQGPDGRPVKVAEDSFTPKDLGERLTGLQKSDQFKAADNAVNMYTAAVQAAQRPGGISDVELRDFAARQFSGGVARQFNVEALNHAQGAWSNLKQIIPELMSGQHMSPAARQMLLQAMHDDAIQAQTSFGSLSASDEAFAQSQGMSLKPYLAPLGRELPSIPALSGIPKGDTLPPEALPPGWPVIGGQPLDPNSAAAAHARELLSRGYRFQNGQWTK